MTKKDLLRKIKQINIEPFTIDETKRYIEEKSNNLKFSDDGFERFYNCTRINGLSQILPNNTLCDENIIKEILLLNIDQIAIMWIYVWERLSSGEKRLNYIFIRT